MPPYVRSTKGALVDWYTKGDTKEYTNKGIGGPYVTQFGRISIFYYPKFTEDSSAYTKHSSSSAFKFMQLPNDLF